MIFDLTVALLAAVVVAVLPGYFWSRLLYGSVDLAERLTYSVVLSLALVPAVALIPATFFGLGVTLAIAVGSALLVFLTGIAALVWFGPSKAPEEPLFPRVGALGPVPLIFLAPALVLVLALSVGAVSVAWAAPLVALGVLLAGTAHVISSQRVPSSERYSYANGEYAEAPGNGPEPKYALLSTALVVALLRGYLGPVRHDWPFIRGVDQYSHAVMANLMLTRGEIRPYLIYPPGLHITIADISRLSGLRPLDLFPVLGPAILALPALALYCLGKRLWGWEVGVAAAFFSSLLGGTYYYFNDAMYPNLIASQFLLVSTITALIRLYASPSIRNGMLLSLLGSAVVLYHQVASLYLALLLALVAVYFLPYLLVKERGIGLPLLSSLALLGSLSVVYAWNTYQLPSAIAAILDGGGVGRTGGTGDAVLMALGSQAPYDLVFLTGVMVSFPVAALGTLGALSLFAGSGKGRSLPGALARTTLLLWILVLFVGSRTAYSGFPQRFGRDLGVPLSLLAALAFVVILRSLVTQRGLVPVYAASVAALCVFTCVCLGLFSSLRVASAPSSQLTITPQIAKAGEWLRKHNSGGNIMVSPQANQVPSRMMLAMGEYPALQSFTPYNISVDRDLPPTGKKPLWDVLWVMNHPTGTHTQRLLKRYDVRYIVLYKSMPDRSITPYWRRFEPLPASDYGAAFENSDVLIVRVQ